MNPNLIIVEDDPIIALDLSHFVKSLGYTQVFTCYEEEQASTLFSEIDRAFVFLDIHLKDKYGGIRLAKLLEHKSHFSYAYITANTDETTLKKLEDTHPVGFIVKPFQEEEVKAILKLGMYQVLHPFKKQKLDPVALAQLFPDLTSTEIRVFMGLYQGASNQEIADTLFVSTNTVKTHLKSIYSKLDVVSRLKAIQLLLSKL